MLMFSRWDATNGGDAPPAVKELRDSLLLTACDNAPLEALEIGSQARDPCDAYDVFPLLAIPLKLLGSGRNSMPISWRIVTIATDDKLVASGQLKHFMLQKLLDRVQDWAKTSESFGEIVAHQIPSSAPTRPPRPRKQRKERREKRHPEFKPPGKTTRRRNGAESREPVEDEEEEWDETREAEEAEKAAERAKEAEQTVLYAHSTWRILCPTLRRPVLKRTLQQRPPTAGNRTRSARRNPPRDLMAARVRGGGLLLQRAMGFRGWCPLCGREGEEEGEEEEEEE
ncbi:unnamed protein product [Closterium sp. NIES-64]|nr:unnamed protein product [Closterium sp. NIES-64]